MNKKELLKKVWNRKSLYYDLGQHSIKILRNLYEFKTLEEQRLRVKSVLEFGCGDGKMLFTLSLILKNAKKFVGFDISNLAIKEAKRRYPKLKFITGDAEIVKFKEKFDLVCSFYTFEHLDEPEKVLLQMKNLVESDGYIFIVCPNYGSPIYPSPVFKGNYLFRLIMGFARDLRLIFSSQIKQLFWNKVEPIIDEGQFHVYDHDTTVEPYVLSLKKLMLDDKDFEVILASSGWETVTLSKVSKKYWFFSLPFQFLGKINFFTFKYWGPVCLLLARKIN